MYTSPDLSHARYDRAYGAASSDTRRCRAGESPAGRAAFRARPRWHIGAAAAVATLVSLGDRSLARAATCLLLLLSLLLSATGCGLSSLQLTETLRVAFTGTLDQPADATGNADPRAETFQLTGVTIVTDKASTAAFSGPAEAIRIIDRPQIVFQYDLTKLEGQSVQSVNVVFGTAVTVDGKYQTGIPLTLPASVTTIACTPQNADDQLIQQDQGKRCDIDVQWHDTVTRDDQAKTESVTPPAFVEIFTVD